MRVVLNVCAQTLKSNSSRTLKASTPKLRPQTHTPKILSALRFRLCCDRSIHTGGHILRGFGVGFRVKGLGLWVQGLGLRRLCKTLGRPHDLRKRCCSGWV